MRAVTTTLSMLWFALLMGFVAPTRADAGEPPADLVADPACALKHTGDLCSMANGSGGTCEKATCSDSRPCLQCVKAPPNSGESSTYNLLIIVGGLITVSGGFFVWRMRHNWK